jgi:hypothetical protein
MTLELFAIWIFRALGVAVGAGLFMAVVVAFIGAVLVIGAQRMLWARAEGRTLRVYEPRVLWVWTFRRGGREP